MSLNNKQIQDLLKEYTQIIEQELSQNHTIRLDEVEEQSKLLDFDNYSKEDDDKIIEELEKKYKITLKKIKMEVGGIVYPKRQKVLVEYVLSRK